MRSISLLLLPLLLSAAPGVAHGQASRLNRCTDAQGQSVYTDRPCDSIGARSRLPPPAPAGNHLPQDSLGARCPRRLSELVQALRTGITGNDVNRLSSLYLWGAVSDAGAQRILGQLESLARRPLVDVVPVYPQQAQALLQDEDPALAGSATEPSTSRHPVGLRLEQTLPGSATRAATVLGLRRQYGCFWITL
ncbi:DUF4124 domain-containing protein [Stenotrophomonas sp. TWI143]|uniref:DUF4124 domain-containing protein n=1 Tax=Stenotrophomonas TaxID=40323 RepID=UPI000DA81550|nr:MULTISPECIES: DUF4124 domain-containing protein [Stenotrophomonas]MBA0221464.1 DUF4124 domain-containing protein [Stenotrophomonas maltophilia]MBH1836780.1 DUF4124 domain-containing protein [Stenotrophomonas maltophilia]MDH0172509.1 DUF4124 domain-containing protein [Stenotrophomonas sp. GD04145]PZT31543.1 DUF4124 domain-containing protein [Stenotrophomonas maltophilia]UXY48925.1 DUF4124 domain-containing protein [Stenotrophomonas maltophilia]